MASGENGRQQTGIGAEFEARLHRLAPQQIVRAIVLLDILPDRRGGASRGQRRSPAEREATIDAVRAAARPALEDMDAILARAGGRRLAPEVDALGAVPVETTPAGVRALAACRYVKAVLEDQPVSLVF